MNKVRHLSGIEIPDEQAEHLTTVGSVIAYIKSNV